LKENSEVEFDLELAAKGFIASQVRLCAGPATTLNNERLVDANT
jgi:hypothetical protein